VRIGKDEMDTTPNGGVGGKGTQHQRGMQKGTGQTHRVGRPKIGKRSVRKRKNVGS